MPPAPQAQYRVRTPTNYLVLTGLLFGLGFVAIAGIVWFVQHGVDNGLDLVIYIVACAVGAIAPFVEWFSTERYRIGGGRHVIRFFDDRLELPHARHRRPIVLARERLTLVLSTSPNRRGTVFRVSDGTQTRTLTTMTLEDRNDGPALLADLQRYANGDVALGRAAHDRPQRTEYDDRLDRELATLD
jgi:hypothetical protein